MIFSHSPIPRQILALMKSVKNVGNNMSAMFSVVEISDHISVSVRTKMALALMKFLIIVPISSLFRGLVLLINLSKG